MRFDIGIAILLLLFGVPCAGAADDLGRKSEPSVRRPEFIVRIESGNRFVGRKYGHGICLDTPCMHILTNYHVAGLIRPGKIHGVAVRSIDVATGPEDTEAVPVHALNGIHRFDPQKDMALVTLKRPLPARFGAAPVSRQSPTVGMDVVRLPASSGRFHGKLIHVGAVQFLDTDQVRHSIHSVLLSDFDSPLGTSGGALCDGAGNVLGLMELYNNSISLPWSVVGPFLAKVDPSLSAELRLEHATAVVKDEEQRETTREVIIRASEDPVFAVRALIDRAAEMNSGMRRVIADAEVRQSGLGTRSQPNGFEVSLYESSIRFRRLMPDGTRGPETDDVPLPQYGVIPGADWEYLLRGLANANVTYIGETLYKDAIAHVFTYTKMACPFRERRPGRVWSGDVECSGEVLADTSYYPVQIKSEFRFESNSTMAQLRVEVQFELTRFANGASQFLPSLVSVNGKFKNSFLRYSASNRLSHFRIFGADHTIIPNTTEAELEDR
jgi:hypothetical protein